jgi:outer membrane immunogenic protein
MKLSKISTAFLIGGGIAIALAIGTPANAASLPTKAPAATASPPLPYSWSGLYVGASAGAAWDHPDLTVFTSVGSTFQAPNKSSFLFGFHAGYNWQFGQFVVGPEFNILFPQHLDSDTVCPNPALNCSFKVKNMYLWGGRGGFAWNNFLFYGSGGWATSQIESDVFNPRNGAFTDRSDANHNGWYAGGGIEYGLMTGVTVGIDYTHVKIESRLDPSVPLGGIDDRIQGGKVDMVRLRLNVILGDPVRLIAMAK